MASLTSCFHVKLSSFHQIQWNKIIKQRMIEGHPDQAILAYSKMLKAGYNGDNFTFPILLKAASHLSSSHIGFVLHGQTIKTGFCIHDFVQTSLLNLYSALGYVGIARKLFERMSKKDLVAWNSMLYAFVAVGQMDEAANFLNLMPVKDHVSFNIMIYGYANNGRVESARRIFDGTPVRDVVSCNSMILAYVMVGEMENACLLFDKMLDRNTVTWNTMIGGYLQNGHFIDAINLFHEMMARGREPNHITLTGVLSACAYMGLVHTGSEIHTYAQNVGLMSNTQVVTSLIDMYAKCGSIERSLEVFYKSQVNDIFCWNAMISGLAIHGNGHASLRLFEDMRDRGIKPDDITFIGLLSGCSHVGLVEEGCRLFELMEDFGVSPKSEHYGCMVDLLGRAGFLKCAYELIKAMPFEPGPTMLGALACACTVHQDPEMGEIVAKHIAAKVDGLSDGEYMMLANMYASFGRWEEANKWRGMMNDAGINKTAGFSMIEVNGRLYKFCAGDIK